MFRMLATLKHPEIRFMTSVESRPDTSTSLYLCHTNVTAVPQVNMLGFSGLHTAVAEMLALSSWSAIFVLSLSDESETGAFRDSRSNNSLVSYQSALVPIVKAK